jgi:predicted ATPase
MLLGENGAGKSTILQALALTLAGQEYRDRLSLPAGSFVRHRAQKGYVRVHLSGSSEPIQLEFKRGSARFGGSPPEPKVLLLGYGATRLLPRKGFASQPESPFARVDNLFNPFMPLADATTWLLGLDDPVFDTVAGSLRRMLPVEDSVKLTKNPAEHRIEAASFNTKVSLEELSDGYQSVVALAVDVMAVMLSRWPTMDAAEGIVLVDELGAHLHPRWRMRITDSLRNVFPRLQFLVSTHDPLCLRGLGDGEVAVLQRDAEGEITVETDLPPVASLRVDQLLTSEYFGLNSTIDPTLDALFAEYYLLKAKRHRTTKEDRRHAELKDQLEELQVLGTTPRERLVLEAADDFLANAGSLADPDQRFKLKQSTKRQIADIWEKAGQGDVLLP